jgi:tetraacyldisaccharide 4'-kinase
LRVPPDEPAWWYRDPPGAVAACLAPLAAVYGRLAMARYARATPWRSPLPVLCVGNLVAGGTGKTPLVLHLCRHLAATGHRPAVLTRGYGGRHAGPHRVGTGDGAADVGDEALLIARSAPVLVARDRAAGARAIAAGARAIAAGEPARPAGTLAADVIVMDDGLQNPQLAKDLTLAVVDGTRGLGNGRVLPAGPLRAPLAFQLGLVDALVVNAADPEAGAATAASLRQRFDGPVLGCTTKVAGDAGWLTAQRVVAWAGIGAPQRFFALLRSLGAEMAETVAFRDHEVPPAATARRLLALSETHRALLVSTEKDLARLQGAAGVLADLAVATRALPIALVFADADALHLATLVAGAVQGHTGQDASISSRARGQR